MAIPLIALVLIDVAIDFIGMLVNPPPTDNVRIPKEEPPTPPPSVDPPLKNPPCQVKPPPTKIIIDPPLDQDPPPLPPERVLPPEPISTDTEKTFTSTVKESLANHKFGCLLARPFYSDDVTICLYDNRTVSDFNDTLISDMKTDIESITEEDTGLGLRLATALVSLDALSAPALLAGVKHINKIGNYYSKMAYIAGSFEVTGLVSVGSINLEDCSLVDAEYEYPPVEVDFTGAECMIPLASYDELEGYKADQLQIIYRSNNYKKDKKVKYFTLPSPNSIDSFTAEFFSGLFGGFQFGATIIEIWLKIDGAEGIRPIQKVQVYSDFKDSESIKTFVYGDFLNYINGCCTGVTIKEYVAKFLDDSDIFVGSFTFYRAVYMGWDKDKKNWLKKADWINKPPKATP